MAVAVDGGSASSSRSTGRGRVEVSVELPIIGKKLVRRHRVLEGRMIWLPYDVATVRYTRYRHTQRKRDNDRRVRSAYTMIVVHAAHVLAACTVMCVHVCIPVIVTRSHNKATMGKTQMYHVEAEYGIRIPRILGTSQ